VNEKLEQLEQRYTELQTKASEPSIVNDHNAYRDAMKAISEIEEVVSKYRELKQVRKGIADTKGMLASIKGEDDLRELAELELADLQAREPVLENDLKVLLQPRANCTRAMAATGSPT
jgi:peptide chain release factor 1